MPSLVTAEKEGAREVCFPSVPCLPLRAAAEDGQRQGGGPGSLQIRVRMSWGGKNAGECPPPPFSLSRSTSRRVSVTAVFAIQCNTRLVRLSSLLWPVVTYYFTENFVYSTFGVEPCIPFLALSLENGRRRGKQARRNGRERCLSVLQ